MSHIDSGLLIWVRQVSQIHRKNRPQANVKCSCSEAAMEMATILKLWKIVKQDVSLMVGLFHCDSITFYNTQHKSLLHLQKNIWKWHFCWNILSFCIGTIVGVSPFYIVTLFHTDYLSTSILSLDFLFQLNCYFFLLYECSTKI